MKKKVSLKKKGGMKKKGGNQASAVVAKSLGISTKTLLIILLLPVFIFVVIGLVLFFVDDKIISNIFSGNKGYEYEYDDGDAGDADEWLNEFSNYNND
jgi:hypothetical protein